MFKWLKKEKPEETQDEKIKRRNIANIKLYLPIITMGVGYFIGKRSGQKKNDTIIQSFQKIFDNLVEEAKKDDNTNITNGVVDYTYKENE